MKYMDYDNRAKDVLKDLREDVEAHFFMRRYERVVSGGKTVQEKLALLSSRIAESISSAWRRFVKRSLDVVVALFALIASFPLLVAIAIAITMESKGPVIYKQVRVGMRGKVFTMFKFRTMRMDAESATGPVWAQKNDPRITHVGNFLRRTHLDELPQFMNVLRGEMSLVGPRPERPHFVSELRKIIPHYDRRLCAKPGITGLAQVKQHYDETIADVKKKVKYDLLYVQKMCPVLDFKLIGLTFMTVFLGTGR